MVHFIASLLLLAGCLALYFGASSYSFLSEDAVLALRIDTLLGLALFLLAMAVAVLACTDVKGRLHAPQSLSALACMIFLFPQGTIAIGSIVNYGAYEQISRDFISEPGAQVYLDQGIAVLDGDIGAKTFATFLSVLERRKISTLSLSSGGGFIDIAMEIGQVLKDKHVDVVVTNYCESACVIIALSGERLFVSPNAYFGFHRASSAASSDSQVGRYFGNLGTEEFMAILRRLGVPQSVLTIAETTPADSMYHLPGDEMIALGLAQDISP